MNIIRPWKEAIVPITPAPTELEGWFKITIRKPDGREYIAAPWQRNMILNQGLDFFGDGSKNYYLLGSEGWIQECRVGSGSNPPAFTDTGLQSQIGTPAYLAAGSTNGAANAEGNPPYYRWQKCNYTFAQGQAVGTWREIGLGVTRGLSTRALIVDTNGDPTSIIVNAEDQVTVTYELRSYITQLTPIVGQMTINNVLYDTVRFPHDIMSTGNMNGTFNYGGGITSLYVCKNAAGNYPTDPWDSQPYLDTMGNNTAVLQGYTNGTYYRDSVMTAPYTSVYWSPIGVTGVRMGSFCVRWFQSFFQNLNPSQGIPHNNTTELVMTMRHSWDRYTPP